MYGLTESTAYATWHLVDAAIAGVDRVVPIGRPIRNAHVYVVDENGQLCPPNAVGEMWIGGISLARGYHKRSDLTGERFLPDPFVETPAARVYRTGDMARQRTDGSIEYLGRVDHQVKIRGSRVELGEIEAVLRQHPAVREAAVLAREDIPGHKRLIAYAARNGDREPTAADLRRLLMAALPDHMMPSAFVVMDAFPLTPNGKLDRRALPAPDRPVGEVGEPDVSPRTPMETVIAEVWQTVLGIDRVGVYQTFFDLGGDSLLAMRAVLQIDEKIGGRLDPKSMAVNTLAQLAAVCERHVHAQPPARPRSRWTLSAAIAKTISRFAKFSNAASRR
jgi:hypothetical protein